MRKNRSCLFLAAVLLFVLPLGAQANGPQEIELSETQSLRLENAHLKYAHAVNEFRVLSQQLEELRELISREQGKEGKLWVARGQALTAVCAELSKEGEEVEPGSVNISGDFKRLIFKEATE